MRIQRKSPNERSKLLVTFVLLGIVVLSSHIATASGPTQMSTNDVSIFLEPNTIIPDAWSKLVRNDAGVSMNLHTSELTYRDAVTVWWVVFNAPENCQSGEDPFRCGLADLGDSDTEPSVLYAAGHIIGRNGIGNFGAHLSTYDTGSCNPGLPCNDGLTNPMGADIHLIVRDHGPAIPGMIDEQIHTFNGGCLQNTCTDLQMSVHEQLG